MKPNRFISAHNHCGFSSYDGLDLPQEHFKWCLENGIKGHAITDHGNMNAYGHAYLWMYEQKKAADSPYKDFVYLSGVEAYFIPSLEQWKSDKAQADAAKTSAREAKKLKSKNEEIVSPIVMSVDPLTDEPISLQVGSDVDEGVDMTNQLTIENEEESKSTKNFNPVNRRNHLVVLPKNQSGLLKIFKLVSRSYLEGFYRFPRVDVDMLREACSTREVWLSTACIGGLISYNIFQIFQRLAFDSLDQKLLDDPRIMDRCVDAVGNGFQMLTDCAGRENVCLELQFNKLPAQNLVNRAILEFAKRSGLESQLNVTCDAHYARPELWKDREIYKRLGWLNYTEINPDTLPKSREELKCELYPKNADQLWEEYAKSKVGTGFYDDQVICDAIERSHDLVMAIGTIKSDMSPKFPNKRLVPVGVSSHEHLVNLCRIGMKKRGLDGRPEYEARLTEELEVIDKMKNADYFVSYQKIIELALSVTTVGPARGSGGGSLVNYVLYITGLDPIYWGLPFSRFLSVYRKGSPDIDSDLANRDLLLTELREFFGYNNVAPISNLNSFKVKSLLSDLAKFYGIPFEEAKAATRTVEQEVRKAVTKHGDDKNLFVLTYEEGLKHSPSFKAFFDKYPLVAESMKVLNMQNKSLGRHAGGVLICDDLPDKMPLITSKGEPQTPWFEGVSYKQLEYVGNFIKYDLLGLDTLRLIEATVKNVIDNAGGVVILSDDRGEELRLSPDEFLVLTDGRRVRADELKSGDEIESVVSKKVTNDGKCEEVQQTVAC